MDLKGKIESKQAIIGVIGLGYVGLPLLMEFVEEGFHCLGLDIDEKKVTLLKAKKSYIKHLSEERVQGIRMAGVIHDVGKIRVPAEILSWPGRLTDIDFNLIKTHPQVGFNILKRIELPRPVTQMMLQHHERMDGSGYPAGLQGEEILLEARILAVADVVEAMASHRPYRAALGVKKALDEISKNRGILYDPEVVDACLKLFTEKNFKFR